MLMILYGAFKIHEEVSSFLNLEQIFLLWIPGREISHILTKTKSFYQNFSFLAKNHHKGKNSLNPVLSKKENEFIEKENLMQVRDNSEQSEFNRNYNCSAPTE